MPLSTPSPLAWSALALVGDGATRAELMARFAAEGAGVDSTRAARLLDQLSALGLVRVARGSGDVRRYVVTTLGHQHVESGVAGAAVERLAELERLRTDLLSTIAHELRTPLTAVRTSVGLLIDPTSEPTDEQRSRLLDTIDRNADRMQRIVGDILDLSRFRSGEISLQLRRFDAVDLARAAIKSIEPLAAARGQQVELIAPSTGSPKVYGDHRRLEQALVNLVSNAERFSPDGGRIDVHVESGDQQVGWRVVDRGPGIPLEDQGRLFERFFVGRNDVSAAREGVGLGLPTALAIAQAHGGTVEVRSHPGHGSTFTLVVPLDGPPEAD